ncbi:MAG: hypothetical protein ACFNP8_04820 [Alloprevotella sp.]
MKVHLLIATMALLLTACRTSRPIETQAYQRDSVRVEYRERTVFVPDTVFFEIPAQSSERTTADSSSHLENDYATSDARINIDGTLYHTLKSKPQAKPVPTQKPIEYRDNIIYRDRVNDNKRVITKYVPYKLSWWEQTQIYGFWSLVTIVVIACRKRIFRLFMRLTLKK